MGYDPFLGEIQIYAFNFVPRDWAECNGQLLPVNQNQALFSLLGTTYGGNGITTFGLPDFRGRANVGFGQGTGLTNYVLGQTFGDAASTVTGPQLPIHNHTATALSTAGDNADPTGRYPALGPTGLGNTYGPAGSASTLATESVTLTGGGQSHANLQPSLTLLFCIATSGVFPTRP